MAKQTRPDVHKAGVFYTCYMLTKFGYTAVVGQDEQVHVSASKNGSTYRFNVNAKRKDGASSFYGLDLQFDFLVILTHILEEPNVYILKSKDVQDFLKNRESDNTGTFWLQIDEYRDKGKYWDEI